METVNLTDSWFKFLAILSSGSDAPWTAMSVIGILVLIIELGAMYWRSRRGTSNVSWYEKCVVAAGVAFLLPKMIIPWLLLPVIDAFLNIVIRLIG